MKTFWWLSAVSCVCVSSGFAANSGVLESAFPSPFANNKVIFTKTTTPPVGPQTKAPELIALLDMDCVAKQGLDSLSGYQGEISLLDRFPGAQSHRKVFKVDVKKPVSNARLSEFANASSCIIGISNEVEYHATAQQTQAFDDPLISSQSQHSFLHTSDFYHKANWLPVDDASRAVIAVIDTGVNYNHPDLSHVIYRKNGQMVGASFVDGTPDFMDDHGHGTHVSGLAAAEIGNGIGGAGVCGESCFVMPVKVLNSSGSGTSSAIDNGIFWAVDHGADVINLSLGRSMNFVGMAPVDLEALRYALMKNVSVAVAAGNDGAVLDMNGVQSWPAMFAALPGLVTVASLDAATGALSTFSNRSSRFVEIAAPGGTSSTNGVYDGLLSTSKDGGYVKMSGTSMATPIVAGSMGLIVSYLKKLQISYSPWDVESVLKSATHSDSALTDAVEGSRVLDLSVLADRLQDHLDHPFRLDIRDAMQAFLNDMYYVILRRDYDAGGAQFYLGVMKDHRLPLETMMLSFFGSSEFKSNFGDLANRDSLSLYGLLNDHFIPDTYLTLVGRLPSADETTYWSNYLTVYRNKNRYLIRSLLKSPEFEARIAGTTLANYPRMETLPIDANTPCLAKDFPQGDFSFEAQVNFGYCIALERAPDAGGKAFYLGLLKNGYKLEDFLLGLFRSQEFSDLNDLVNTTDGDYVRILYYTILQRFPKDYEWYYWQNALKSMTRDQVLSAFITSAEFQALLKAKGIRQ